MKNLMSFLMITLLAVMVMTSCELTPIEPTDDPVDNPIFFEPFVARADIQLVRMGNDNQNLTKIAAGEDIDFGQILATESINFILTNTGNVNLFNITLEADSLIVFPGNVGDLGLPEGGLTTSPIVSITAEHVLPRSGVGSLLDMEIGEFTDSLILSYQYEIIPFLHAVLNETQIVALMDSIAAINDSTGDTTWVWAYGDTLLVAETEKDTVTNQLEYSVGGTKMGAVIELVASGVPLENYSLTTTTFFPIGFNQQFLSLCGLTTNDLDTVVINNDGNVPLRVKIYNVNSTIAVLDTIVEIMDQIDISGVLRGDNYSTPNISGPLLFLGNSLNQPYIISFYNQYYTDGSMGLFICENP